MIRAPACTAKYIHSLAIATVLRTTDNLRLSCHSVVVYITADVFHGSQALELGVFCVIAVLHFKFSGHSKLISP